MCTRYSILATIVLGLHVLCNFITLLPSHSFRLIPPSRDVSRMYTVNVVCIRQLNSVASLRSVTYKEHEGHDGHNHLVSAGLPILTLSKSWKSRSALPVEWHLRKVNVISKAIWGFSRISLYNKSSRPFYDKMFFFRKLQSSFDDAMREILAHLTRRRRLVSGLSRHKPI